MADARIFVAGSHGQVALSLQEEADKRGITLTRMGRPDFDLTAPESMRAAITGWNPTAIINAAAYTAVDAAEDNEETATAINAAGAGELAAIAADLNVPFLHISTDYVFDGTKDGAYCEEDEVAPQGAYGRSKLAGEKAVMDANPDAMIFRTAWVYSPFGKNFCKTMLTLAQSRNELGIVADQMGNPTYAPDIANALLDVLAQETSGKAGVYHLAGTGETSWHGFAEAIFNEGAKHGNPLPKANAITTADFPTPAKRPANSRLNCDKLASTFGVQLPKWQESTANCVKRLFEEGRLG
jgi:dTDP-4-dehydrorhamnose reductase